MSFSFTGIAYLLVLSPVVLLTYRFFKIWREEKTTISLVFLLFTGLFMVPLIISVIVGLFFARDTEVLRLSVIFVAFLQSFPIAIIGYLIFFLKFPKISPWFAFSFVLALGLAAAVLTAIIPVEPVLEESGGINWGSQPLPDRIRLFVFFITFLPLLIILFQQAKNSQNSKVKIKAYGLVTMLVLGILIGFFDFFLQTILDLGAISRDIAISILGIIVFAVLFLTQKPKELERPETEYQDNTPYPQIKW